MGRRAGNDREVGRRAGNDREVERRAGNDREVGRRAGNDREVGRRAGNDRDSSVRLCCSVTVTHCHLGWLDHYLDCSYITGIGLQVGYSLEANKLE